MIFLVWLVYATSYLGKVNYSSNITQIIDFYRISKAEAGLPQPFSSLLTALVRWSTGFCAKNIPSK